MVKTIFCVTAIALAFVLSHDFTAFGQTRPRTAPTSLTKPRRADAGKTFIVLTEPKAAVWINNLRRGTTDASGRLEVKRLPAGTRDFRVRAVGFVEKTGRIASGTSETTIALTPTTDSAEIAFQTAEFLRESGKPDDKKQAAEQYQKSLELRPNFAAAHIGWARLLETSDPEGALEQIAAARKDRPNSSEASTVEGRIHREAADFANAQKSFQRAIRESRGAGASEAYTGLALTYKDQSNFAAAVAAFQTALKQLADSEPIVYQLLGETYEQMGRPKEAVANYQRYLALAPDSSLAPAVSSIVERLRQQATADRTARQLPRHPEAGELLELMPQ